MSDFNFAIKGPRLWNSLPMDLRQAPSVMTFKKRPIQKTLLFPETENTSALTGYKIKKALYK